MTFRIYGITGKRNRSISESKAVFVCVSNGNMPGFLEI